MWLRRPGDDAAAAAGSTKPISAFLCGRTLLLTFQLLLISGPNRNQLLSWNLHYFLFP